MAVTKINGNTQILAGTIPLSALVNGYSIPTGNLVDGANFFKKDGSITATGSFNLGGFVATNSGAPSAATDLTTKSYVDAKVNGLSIHPFMRAVAATNIVLTSPGSTIDLVSLAAGDRVFLIGQSNPSQNGPWVWSGASTTMTRPADWATGSTQPEGAYWISDPDGNIYKNSKFFTNNTSTITVDTTAVTFSQDNSGVYYTSGNGLTLVGTQFKTANGNGISLDGSNNITVTADTARGIQTSATGVGISDATTGGMVAISNASNKFTWVALSGDVLVAASGATTVNNISGSGFVKYTNFVTNETPGGTVNGANTAFTLANTPVSNSLTLELNGVTLDPGSGNDYILSGINITMSVVPISTDKLRAYYMK